MIKIMGSISNQDLLSNFHDNYIQSLNVKIKLYNNCMYVYDLAHALQANKECIQYIIQIEDHYGDDFSHLFINWLDEWDVMEFVDTLIHEPYKFRGITVRTQAIPAMQVYSPFVSVKPVTQPKSWKTKNIWQAILSGQITKGTCDGRYTDDYALDAQNNLSRGPINLLDLAIKLIEDPKGWQVSASEEVSGILKLSVNRYHYNNNTLYIDFNQ